MSGIVIIGAGECGVRAAFSLRERGFVGPVTLINGEAGAPYERPPLSKNMNLQPKLIRSLDDYVDANIDMRSSVMALYIEPGQKKIVLSDNSTLFYDKLLIATGARANVLSGMENTLTLRTDKDANEILSKLKPRSHIGVIGGGFIGLELAATAVQAGARVTVIEGAKHILQRTVPKQIADLLYERHIAEGVEIRTETVVRSANATSITLDDDTILEFDAVVAGVGALPNTEIARKASLTVTNGIAVDSNFCTSDPSIYAAGDCCNFNWRGKLVRLESWKAAQDQGVHAAACMLGADESYNKVPWFWSDQYDLTLQVAGLFDINAEIKSRNSETNTHIVFQCDSENKLLAVAGIGIGTGNAASKELKIFEKLIERKLRVDKTQLMDASFNPKILLKAGQE